MKKEDTDIKELFLQTQRDFSDDDKVLFTPSKVDTKMIPLPFILGLISSLSIIYYNETSLSEFIYYSSANLYESCIYELGKIATQLSMT